LIFVRRRRRVQSGRDGRTTGSAAPWPARP